MMTMNKNLFIVVGLALLAMPNCLSATERPNVLIIMADDCTHSDLPAYGGENAKTPNLDALSKQSLVFNRAYLCSAMCQPCRAELYSGQYPMRNGCAWNHSASRGGTRSLPHYLGELDYRVGLAGKVHVAPGKAFPFELVNGFDKNCVRNPTKPHDLAAVTGFMSRDGKQPFCLVVALVEPHVPWVMGDPSQYPVDELKLPPNIADTIRTREDFAKYLAEITYMDGQVGELLAALEASGKSESTIVMFTSEQGAQFPGCKWTNWDTGVHTALMARWPGKIKEGVRTEALVQYADFVPTILEACGGDVHGKPLDGTSFFSVLMGKTEHHRNYVFGMHNNYPEGPAYPIRSITDGEFHYIRNLSPDQTYIEKHLMGVKGDGLLNNPYWGTWIWDSTTSQRTYGLVKRYMHRPAEQLYRLSNDKYEMENLADQLEHALVKQQLSAKLDQWMQAQGDPGIEQDTPESHKAAKQGRHRFVPPEDE
jgi:N-sulfoglucosamine sulfohydrolase